MKKIVALVLTLVLALSLATVAFGATTFVKDETYYVKDAEGVWAAVTFVPAYEEDGEGNVAYFSGDHADYVECEKTATGAMKLYTGMLSGDTLLGYVKVARVNYTLKGEAVAKSDTVNCTTDFHAKGYKYVDGDGNVTYYVDDASETPAKEMLVAGKVKGVKVDESAVLGGHALVLNKTKALDDDETIYEYKCVRCGQTFQAVAAGNKVAGVEYTKYTCTDKLKTAYENAGYSVTNVVMDTLYLIGVKAAASTGVSSAKTFDAGVALYAGMALMSVAGSAVVIGKKKEF